MDGKPWLMLRNVVECYVCIQIKNTLAELHSHGIVVRPGSALKNCDFAQFGKDLNTRDIDLAWRLS